MKRSVLAISIALTTLVAGSGAAEAQQTRPGMETPSPKMLTRPHLANMKSPVIEAGAAVTAYEMHWGYGGVDAARKRLSGALGVLIGGETAQRLGKTTALERALQKEEAGSWTRLADSEIMVRYDPEFDEIRLLNEELDLFQDASNDIGIERAQQAAESYLKQLAEAGAIDARLYERAALQVGYAMVGDGSFEKEVQPGRVVEYRFTFRPRLNGFEMANAGLRLGILTSGQLANLRFGGVSPRGEWKNGELQSTAKNSIKKIRVSSKDLMQRFYKSVPPGAEPQVAWSRVMYAMPEGKSRAVVEPMFIVSYTLHTEVNGQRVASRRKTLAYSLTDPEAPPLDFDAPAAKHEGSEQTREYEEQAEK